jgi:hypothetical protein
MKKLRTGGAAKQDAVFTYTLPRDESPRTLTPAEELLLRRIEVARASGIGRRERPWMSEVEDDLI